MRIFICQSYISCERGEIHTQCGTTCPLTCANIEKPPQHCEDNCFVGCVCREVNQSGYENVS
ncbi:hypothetical protein B4U79_18049 [Dinothrombium tinctorium]|uniref:TIL domain-containing protein n=1 Tax=Dinothrombium tinctorium TaxID=1965070 RepID=A0A3S3PIW1_9ACAR|nr:hypothetical protein B4U79_18083 [Dinothrombium tinctorium]RWS11245.1 hypothetical protein B4U79_18051 [Dinothrombium tinctorium]RWS11268.1 hypothetical protein B4U79_18049 [Dinothrombium tinctorium]